MRWNAAIHQLKCCGIFTYSCALQGYRNTSVWEELRYRLSVQPTELLTFCQHHYLTQHRFSNTQKDPWPWQWKCVVLDGRYVQRPAGNKVTSVDETKSDHTCWHFLQEESTTMSAHKCAIWERVSSRLGLSSGFERSSINYVAHTMSTAFFFGGGGVLHHWPG